jgi:DedD protein
MSQQDTDATLDGQLELKKRSRRRLVGAAALALLAIIVLPMVMDHEPRQAVQDIQVRIPSQDGAGIAARILPNKATETPLPPALPDSATDAPTTPVGDTKPVEVPKEEAKPAEAEKPVVKPVEKPAEKAAEKPAPKPAEKPVDKAADKAVAVKAEEARAHAALAGTDTSADQWLVLLGAYKDAANVKQLTAKLKQIGVPTLTEKFDSPQGARTRVRAGPFKSREAAVQALTKMKKIGVDGSVKQSSK